MEEIFVNITKNTRVIGSKKQIRINPKDNFEKILLSIGTKLGFDAKILYNQSGAQIDSGNDMRDGETIYVSEGEQFWPKDSNPSENLISEKRVLKLGIIGPPSVGKSAISVRYIQKVFIDEYLPSFENLFKKDIILKGKHVEVDILDSSGMDELVVMRPTWFKEREGFVMVYAINDRPSFEALDVFHDQLLSFRQGSSAPIIVVGNKSDLNDSRKVKKEEAIKKAKEWGADYIEASAKKDENVTQIFEIIVQKLYNIKYPIIESSVKESDCCLLL